MLRTWQLSTVVRRHLYKFAAFLRLEPGSRSAGGALFASVANERVTATPSADVIFPIWNQVRDALCFLVDLAL